MSVRLDQLPKDVRDRIAAEHGKPVRSRPSRSEAGKRTVGRCIPTTGVCDWTGPYGAGFERHTRESGHSRLELIDTEAPADG